ncbi:hypothetical protein ISF_01481 [Cordyceps fumosorosea ARSEF 2679]|uniref:TeaA receptor TeaR n=1 Tax=Cordyceps fumosorosea (strain ARSEF 2679) TaxID=1081104 RepID=A0A168DBQ5_CORFA|nr:hypothetical protein ISF_01481 [Cordyceps fumosorosea ARSEF 2679]OAA72408.1 hypothetical protein ISF_01481 [Cordyceps fumosorosea ARSEF 2679]
MAAVASVPAPASALTPPSSSHGDENNWDYSAVNGEDQHLQQTTASYEESLQSSALPAHDARAAPRTYTHDITARKMRSADNLHSSKWSKSSDHQRELLPGLSEEEKAKSDQFVYSQDQSKWIHRDKLARIETEELEAAGFFLPKGRSSSRAARRNESRLSHTAATTESDPNTNRAKKDSTSLEPPLSSPPSWDLRTPQEIAEADSSSYFTSNALTGSTRIPVAKISPAPISLEFLEHGSMAARQNSDEDDDGLAYNKVRSRSASAAIRDSGSAGPNSKRPITDSSPKKHARKNSSSTPTRPGTRGKDSLSSSGSRPPTRNGRTASRAKHPEGEPPWMANTFKPDPRLPPDQQIPPFVAKKLAQEQMEKEGTFGDAYDKDLRPLNTNSFAVPKPNPDAEPEKEGEAVAEEEWPLKPAITSRPLMRTGSMYSTMPKIIDKPPGTPVPSPRPANTAVMGPPPAAPQIQQVPQVEPEDTKKGGCGCCVVM